MPNTIFRIESIQLKMLSIMAQDIKRRLKRGQRLAVWGKHCGSSLSLIPF
jgi:hypothetical protein